MKRDIEREKWRISGSTPYVESLGGETGAKFTLIPPDNATGNYEVCVDARN